jgi:hypothetical protein
MFKASFISLLIVLALFPDYRTSAQPAVLTTAGHGSICYGSDEVRLIYIPPPPGITDKKGGGSAQIEVAYTGFTNEARAAFSYAVDIWSSLLRSDVKIKIRAIFTTMSEPGALASAGATSYYRGSSINAQFADLFYPVALAEKIAARDLNDEREFDIDVRFNSAAAWFYGLSGSTPSTNYDFVTVAIHELCHGLGFADSFNTTESQGSYGLSGTPVIYDNFVEDNTGKRLTNKLFYANPSPLLRAALTGNSLFFSGPLTMRHTSGIRPQLYAPGTWDSGSSVSHLNESNTPQVDALMTPFVARGEAIHDPGKLTMSMLGDLGWINTRIVHTPVDDSELNLSEVDLSFDVLTDTLLQKGSIKLYFSRNGSGLYDSLSVGSSVTGGTFHGSIPIPEYNTLTSYYLAVSDTFGRTWNSPSAGRAGPYTFFIGADTVKPIISHKPLAFILSELDTLTIEAVVTDNLYPVNVLLEYRLNSLPVNQIAMASSEADTFTAGIVPSQLGLTGTDTLYYRIIASDEAISLNTSTAPATGFYKLPVYSLLDPVEYYFNSFSQSASDFLLDGFEVVQPAGFTNQALHTRHPYESPEVNGQSIDYYATLRHPVAVDSSGIFLSFREIVLVEPGEPGFDFGTGDFYDYVVIEASRDGGKSWTPLADGYDSRADTEWLAAYNGSITGQNSTYTGKPEMFRQRTISLDTNSFLNAGDTIVLRFRLFSDPFANGWGWVIDDLFIKGISSSAEKTLPPQARLWPNPGNGLFNLDLGPLYNQKKVSVSVTDFQGRRVISINDVGEQLIGIDISGYPDGVYFIVVESGGHRSAVRYLLISN